MAEAAAAEGAPIPSTTKSQSPPTAISCLLVDHANARTLQVCCSQAWESLHVLLLEGPLPPERTHLALPLAPPPAGDLRACREGKGGCARGEGGCSWVQPPSGKSR